MTNYFRISQDVSLYVFALYVIGAKGSRTPDLSIANAALSQLSYRPKIKSTLNQTTVPNHHQRHPSTAQQE